MNPTANDIQRTVRATETFGFDPLEIGTNHLRWWIIDRADWHWCNLGYEGYLIVMARDYPYYPLPPGVEGEKPTVDLRAIGRPNFIEVPNASKEEGCVFYIFKPLEKEE